MAVHIITDSASDLPRDSIESFGIEVMPLMVYLGDEEFTDGGTLEQKEMFDGMRAGRVYKTAQVPLYKFREVFEAHARAGDACLYVAFSSGLSGTYQSAVMIREQLVEEYPDFQLEIIDTKCASTGFGLVVLEAARLAREGGSLEEITAAVRGYAERMQHIFTVDNLEYLFRGGRVSRTAALIGGLLNIKPVLHMEDGKLIPLEKARGRRKAIERMASLMVERGRDLERQTIGISHGDDLEAVEQLKAAIREKTGREHTFLVSLIGGVVGAHSGPGTLALFFLS